MEALMTHPFLIRSPHEVDHGHLIGRDPRTITEAEWQAHMPDVQVGLKAIRAKCLDCAHNYAEVNKCTAIACPLWPLRMGSQPAGLRAMRRAEAGSETESAEVAA